MKPKSPRVLTSTIAVLLAWPVLSEGATRTWTGGGTSATWSNPANWDTGVPQNGDTIVFAGVSRLTNFNDLNNLDLAGITFSAGGFNIAGNPVTLNGALTNNGANTFALDATISTNANISSAGGTLTVTGILSGPGSITRTGTTGVIFTSNNTFSGGLQGTGGDIQIGDSGPAGSAGTGGVALTAGTLFIRRTGALVMNGPITTPGSIYASVGTPADPLSGLTLGPGNNTFNYLGVGNGQNGINNPAGNRFGRLFINTGTTVTGNQFFVGEQTGGTGQVIQTGGDVTVNQVRVGHWPQADVGAGVVSTYTISGGSLNLNGNPADPFNEGAAGIIFLGIDSTGVLKIDGGTVTAAAVSLDNRGATGGEDTLELNGGTLNLGARGISSQNAGDPSTYEVKFSGGTYRANATHTSDVEITATGGTGVVFDTNGNTVTLPRALSGTGGFTKAGTGTLEINGFNTYGGSTVVSGGTLSGTGNISGTGVTVAAGGTVGGGLIVEVPVQVDGGTITGTATLSNALTMSSGLVEGAVTLNGNVTANGGLIRTSGSINGTVQINGGAVLAGTPTVTATTTVANLGRIESTGTFAQITLNSGGTISPAGDAQVGTLTASGLNLTAGGNTLRWNVGSSTDLLTITPPNGFTTSTTANTVIEIVPTGAIGAGTYDLIDYAGTIQGGGLARLILGQVPHIVAALVNDTVNTKVQLSVTGADTLIWTPAANNTWNTNGDANWKLQSNGNVVPFFAFDQVLFNDTASNKVVQVAPAGFPASMVFNATSNYTVQGGAITGAGTLTKNNSNRLILLGNNTFTGATAVSGGTLQIGDGTSGGFGVSAITIATGASVEVNLPAQSTIPSAISAGGGLTFLGANSYTASGVISGNAITINMTPTGVVTLSGANSYTGTTIVTSGTLRAGSDTALGFSDGDFTTLGDATVINSGATLDVNGQNLGSEEILVQGTGADGNGAIVNNGPSQATLKNIHKVRLAGNTSIGGNNGRLEFRDSGLAGQIFDLAGFTLTKVGPNQASLVNIDMTPGSIVIDGGTLSIEANSLVDATGGGTLSINLGGQLGLYANVPGRLTKSIIANGGGIRELGSGGGTVSAPLGLRANTPIAVDAGGGNLVWEGIISESGGSFGLNMSGPGIFSLAAANTFTGTTAITAGTLRIGNGGTTGSIPAANQIVNSGAVEFRRSDKVTIPNSITNPGNNTAAGKVRINAGVASDTTTGVEITGAINTGAVAVGEFNNSFGRLFIAPAASINTGTFFVGEQTGATGQVVQNGGSVTITGQFRVGHWPQADSGGPSGTTSTYVLNSGSISLTAAPGVAFSETDGNTYLGIDSTGSLTVNGGTFTTGGLVLDNRGATAGVDLFELNGGAMNIGQNGVTSPNAADLSTYLVNLGGGTIHMTAGSTSNVAATLTGTNGSTTFDVDAAVSSSWTGALSGTGGINKTGPGTLALSGANTFAGQLAVAAGTLLANTAGGSSSGAAGVLVGAGGTLGGSGTVGDGSAITVALSGKLSPGANGTGTLTFNLGGTGTLDLTGAVTPASSSSLLFELGATAAASDKVLLNTGKLTIGTGVLGIDDFSFALLNGFTPGTYTLFDSSVAITGSLGANLTGTIAPGFTGTLSLGDSGRDVVLQVIPEPTAAMAFIAATTLLGLRRRRRH